MNPPTRKILSGLTLLAIACMGGCAPVGPEPAAQNHGGRVDPAYAKLRAETDEVVARNRILQSRVDELLAREQRLSEEAHRLRTMNAQLDNQVRALAGVPLQRDALRARCEKLEQQVAELQQRLAELQQTPPAAHEAPSAEPTAASTSADTSHD